MIDSPILADMPFELDSILEKANSLSDKQEANWVRFRLCWVAETYKVPYDEPISAETLDSWRARAVHLGFLEQYERLSGWGRSVECITFVLNAADDFATSANLGADTIAQNWQSITADQLLT